MQEVELLIEKLFNGTCSEAELQKLLSLIEQNPSLSPPGIMEELMSQIQPHLPIQSETTDSIFEKIRQETAATPTQKSGLRLQEKQTVSLRSRVFAIAASFVLLCGLIGWFVLSQPDEVLLSTAAGQVSEHTLPDGSKVTLNGNTVLRYDKNWLNEPIRTVFLEGEAYFEVEKKVKSQPKFQVKTPNLRVEVLGTIFNVNSRASQTEVFLEEGKVQIQLLDKVGKDISMEPGEFVRYQREQTQDLEVQKTYPGLHTSWRTGILELVNTPLGKVIEKISAAHDIEISINDRELADRKLTTGLPLDDLDLTLQVLERMLDIHIQQREDIIILERKKSLN